jgi:hypothetical protein
MATRLTHPSTLGPAAQAALWASSQPAETDPDGGTDPEPAPNEEAAEEGDADPREPGPYSRQWTRTGRDRSHLQVVPDLTD